MKTLEELQQLIFDWANERDLINVKNAPKQRLKLIEECGELASAILKNNLDEQKDAIGDIFVVLVILAHQTNDFFFDFEDDGYFDDLPSLISGLIESNTSIECIFSFLANVTRELKLDLTECANLAYNQIKDRKGITVNGTFIKK